MPRLRVLVSLFAAIFLLGAVHAAAVGQSGVPRVAGCPVFPSDNPWNQRVDGLPVVHGSAQMVANIGDNASVMPDFFAPLHRGDPPIGLPYGVVTNQTHWVRVRFRYPRNSNSVAYPLPSNVPIQGGRNSSGDRHVLVIDRTSCIDYELWDAYPHDGGRSWTAGVGAVWDLRTNHMRPNGWTSADAAGLPMFPGLARYEEVAAGAIDHALRFTAPCVAHRWVYPARHVSASCSGRWMPPMGARLRLKAGVDISRLPYQARVIATALKRYGLILADNGGPWQITGAPCPYWNNSALLALERLKGRDFEVVNTSSLPHPG